MFPEIPQEIGSIHAYRDSVIDKLEHDDNNEDYDSLVELMCADCLICGEAVKQQNDTSENAGLIDEIIRIAEALDSHDEYYVTRYRVCSWTLELCANHPRLRVRLLEATINAFMAIEGTEDYDAGQLEVYRSELARFQHNIACADLGEFDKIEGKGYLLYDPVEWTEQFENVIDRAEAEAYRHLTDVPRGLGFCHAYWQALKDALAAEGVEWRTPYEMNPKVMFD